jgi:sec-independent protein translocase protein TatC
MEEPEAKSFLDHLEDLRWTIIKGAGTLLIGVVLCFVITPQLLTILEWPLKRAGQDPKQFLHVLGVMDPLSMQMEISLAGGFILALPFILYFLGQFLLPALTAREKRLILPVFAAGTLLFVGGVAFCFFVVLPQTINFFLWYNGSLNLVTEWTIQNYVDFVVQMIVAFGLSFETPLVIITLNYFGIVRSYTLSHYRRHAILVIVVLACCITPATDPISIGMIAGPMYLLYESTIWITKWMERKEEEEVLE